MGQAVPTSAAAAPATARPPAAAPAAPAAPASAAAAASAPEAAASAALAKPSASVVLGEGLYVLDGPGLLQRRALPGALQQWLHLAGPADDLRRCQPLLAAAQAADRGPFSILPGAQPQASYGGLRPR